LKRLATRICNKKIRNPTYETQGDFDVTFLRLFKVKPISLLSIINQYPMMRITWDNPTTFV